MLSNITNFFGSKGHCCSVYATQCFCKNLSQFTWDKLARKLSHAHLHQPRLTETVVTTGSQAAATHSAVYLSADINGPDIFGGILAFTGDIAIGISLPTNPSQAAEEQKMTAMKIVHTIRNV